MICLLSVLASCIAIGMGIDHLNGRFFRSSTKPTSPRPHKFHEAMHEAKMPHSHPMPIRHPPNSEGDGLAPVASMKLQITTQSKGFR